MITRTKDALVILLALIAILGCGFGMGRLVSTTPESAPPPPSVTIEELETRTLLSLRDTLDLTPEQEALLLPEIQSTTREVLATRQQALQAYHLHMLALHDQLAPHLNARQQEILNENRAKLQDSIDQRFPSLLKEEPVAPSNQAEPSTPTP